MSSAMTNLVKSVLVRPETSKINFSVKGVLVNASSFKIVNNKLISGALKAEYDSKLAPLKLCKYDSKKNIFYLGFRICSTPDKEVQIVHECVHAARDLGLSKIQKKVDEAVAYIAQASYFYYRYEHLFKKGAHYPKFPNVLFKEAWHVASLARGKPALNDADVNKLLQIISLHPLYKNTANNITFSDG